MARYGGAAVTDADRDAAGAQLREHYAAGRILLDEFRDRMDAVYRAQTAPELGRVIDGLPHEGVVIPPGAPRDSSPGGHPLNLAEMRATMARAGRRILLASAVVTAGILLVFTLLVTAFLVRGGLLGAVLGALLLIFAVGVAAVGALAWLARRLWLRHAWIEAAALVAGQPWLSWVARMARLLLTGHALWRLRTRLASRG